MKRSTYIIFKLRTAPCREALTAPELASSPRKPWWGALSALLIGAALCAAAPQSVSVGEFSTGRPGAALPAEWKPLEFTKIPRHTTYSLVEDEGRTVVRARSEAAASGLVRRLRIDPRQYPILRWRWRAMNLIRAADVHTKAGDDYPARVYVTFEYDSSRVGVFERAKFEAIRLVYGEYPPIAAINYLWEGREPRGAIVPNAYTARARMIVVESGSQRLGEWIDERRDVVADYRRAFGEEPPAISGVAIMTDTDDTGE